MGKRLPKKQLLVEISKEKEALDALLRKLTPAQMCERGVTPGGWSVKDMLAHILGWQQRLLGWHATELRGETAQVPAPGLTWRDLKKFNQMIYEEHRDRSLKPVLRDYDAFHHKMLELIERTPEKEFLTPRLCAWMGPTWTLSDWCRAETAAHYHWAQKWIRPWLRERQQLEVMHQKSKETHKVRG